MSSIFLHLQNKWHFAITTKLLFIYLISSRSSFATKTNEERYERRLLKHDLSNLRLNIHYITRRRTCKCLILSKKENNIMPANISITLFRWIKFNLIKYIFISKLIKQLPQKVNISRKNEQICIYWRFESKKLKKNSRLFDIYLCKCLGVLAPLQNVSLMWRRYHYW